MKVVQRACVVVTEDMPVDPDARDLQVCQYLLPLRQVFDVLLRKLYSRSIRKQIVHGFVMSQLCRDHAALCGTCSIAAE